MSVVAPISTAAVPSGWVLTEEPWFVYHRVLTFEEAVRHEWGEAVWTARILADGEGAQRWLDLYARDRVGCF